MYSLMKPLLLCGYVVAIAKETATAAFLAKTRAGTSTKPQLTPQSPLFLLRPTSDGAARSTRAMTRLASQHGNQKDPSSSELHCNEKNEKNDNPKNESSPITTTSGSNIYSLPALYDLAFGYRNYEDEVSFLIETHERLTQRPPSSVLELAAGPARHCLTALSQNSISAATAVDLSPEMVEYARTLAEEEFSDQQRQALSLVCGDMRNLTLGEAEDSFDTAWILLGSLQHLQTNQDVLACFSCLHSLLKNKGTLLLELPHPRETFSMGECTKNGWQVPLDDVNGDECGELQIVWGDQGDALDEIAQVRQFTVAFKLLENGKTVQDVQQVVPMRLFTAQEIDALATCAGFQVVAHYGALATDLVDVQDEDEAFRLICVLQKV